MCELHAGKQLSMREFLGRAAGEGRRRPLRLAAAPGSAEERLVRLFDTVEQELRGDEAKLEEYMNQSAELTSQAHRALESLRMHEVELDGVLGELMGDKQVQRRLLTKCAPAPKKWAPVALSAVALEERPARSPRQTPKAHSRAGQRGSVIRRLGSRSCVADRDSPRCSPRPPLAGWSQVCSPSGAPLNGKRSILRRTGTFITNATVCN